MNPISPGEKAIFNEVEYVAAGPSYENCNIGNSLCAFARHDSAGCDDKRCRDIVWLTQANYIIHRLTS